MHAMQLVAPTHVTADPRGRVWIADAAPGAEAIVEAEPDGRVIARWPVPDAGGEEAGRDAAAGAGAARASGVPAPRVIAAALSARGDAAYVTDSRTGTVWRIGAGGRGGPARAACVGAGLAAPVDVAVDDEAGRIYAAGARGVDIADLAGGRVEALALPAGARPRGVALAFDRRRLYVVDAAAPAVLAVDLVTGAVTRVVTFDAPPGPAAPDTAGGAAAAAVDAAVAVAARPIGIAVTAGGLVVADPDGGRLLGVNPRHGTAVTLWRGSGDGALGRPAGVAWDRAGRAYLVADPDRGRVLRVRPDAASARPLRLWM